MIYIVEDDAGIRELEQYALENGGFTVRSFADGAAFLAALEQDMPELVVLDVMLPDEDGCALLTRLRRSAATRRLPVLMVTAKTAELDIVKGLDAGADDYLCKPFGVLEFISRVRAVLRRSAGAGPDAAPLLFRAPGGDIVLDDGARTVAAGGAPVVLTYKEYALLHLFLQNPEQVLSRERIMKEVWDTADLLESRTIDMHVRALRQKLGPAGEAIRTVRKVGYKLSAESAGDAEAADA